MRISRKQFLIDSVLLTAQRSTCARKHVGALAVRRGRIICTGYNGAPPGIPHCVHDLEKENNPQYGAYPGCQEAVHAEANLIAYASRFGLSLESSTLYCTCAPCLKCAQLIISAGFGEVYYLEEYRKTEGVDLLRRAGVHAFHLEKPTELDRED